MNANYQMKLCARSKEEHWNIHYKTLETRQETVAGVHITTKPWIWHIEKKLYTHSLFRKSYVDKTELKSNILTDQKIYLWNNRLWSFNKITLPSQSNDGDLPLIQYQNWTTLNSSSLAKATMTNMLSWTARQKDKQIETHICKIWHQTDTLQLLPCPPLTLLLKGKVLQNPMAIVKKNMATHTQQ